VRSTLRDALLGAVLLGGTTTASFLLMLAGRQKLLGQSWITPDTQVRSLQRWLRWHPDPERRREAAFVLHGASSSDDERSALMRAQGWGRSPLAAVALKLQAQAARAVGREGTAAMLWQELDSRFPEAPARADSLYWLSREQPERVDDLLTTFAAHPAALAAAVELGEDPEQRLKGARHLARWGAGWPGAGTVIEAACLSTSGIAESGPGAESPPMVILKPSLRRLLAFGLSEAGRHGAATECLADTRADAQLQLALARRQLWGSPQEKRQGEEALLLLAQQDPNHPAAMEAVRLLAADHDTTDLLARLPQALEDTAPVAAHRALARAGEGGEAVLSRWPDDPASWEMAWSLARASLLQGNWAEAQRWLDPLTQLSLPSPQRSRAWFWMGLSHWQQDRPEAARSQWRQLLECDCWGYYAWRASVRLEMAGLPDPTDSHQAPLVPPWRPLGSGDRLSDDLWRLNQPLEAWETWRLQRKEPPGPRRLGLLSPEELQSHLAEGRLRLGVGDAWRGLDLIDRARLRWTGTSCEQQMLLEESAHPVLFSEELTAAADEEEVSPLLLLAVARQESRFSPGVTSVAGAVGLLQLMPDTATELHGDALTRRQLDEPALNAHLGSRYLNQLLRQWDGSIIPVVASYNAGPGAVGGWITPELEREPEVWIERIPYQETRLYVKKVLGNAWSYGKLGHDRCPTSASSPRLER